MSSSESGQVSPRASRGNFQRPMPSSSVLPVKTASALLQTSAERDGCQSACASGLTTKYGPYFSSLRPLPLSTRWKSPAFCDSRIIGTFSFGRSPSRTISGRVCAADWLMTGLTSLALSLAFGRDAATGDFGLPVTLCRSCALPPREGAFCPIRLSLLFNG
ncbi:hypothetical protein D3C87_1572050 [compost metagenome]